MNKLVFFNKWLILLNIFCIDIVFGFEKERKSEQILDCVWISLHTAGFSKSHKKRGLKSWLRRIDE